MAEKIGDLGVEIGADVKKLNQGLKDAEKQVGSFEKNVANLGNSLQKSFLGGVFAGNLLANAFSNLANVSRQFVSQGVSDFLSFERASLAMQKTIGAGSEELISQLKKASSGTIAELDLITTANRALALGIEQSKLPELLEVARARAKLMNIDTTQAFGDIATGIGRQSKMILDNLGIVFDMNDAYKEYAASIGVSVDALSDFERKQAIVNKIILESQEVVRDLGGEFETTADTIERAQAKFSDFRRGLVGGLATGVGAFIEERDIISQVNEELAKGGDSANSFAIRLEEAGIPLQQLIENSEKVQGKFQFGRVFDQSAIADAERVLKQFREEQETNAKELDKANYLKALLAIPEDLQAGFSFEQFQIQAERLGITARELVDSVYGPDSLAARRLTQVLQEKELEMQRQKNVMDQETIAAAERIAEAQGALNDARSAGLPDAEVLLALQDALNQQLEGSDDRTKKLAATLLTMRDSFKSAKDEINNTKEALANFNRTTGLGDVTERAFQGFLSSIPQAVDLGNGKFGVPSSVKQNDFVMRPGKGAVPFSSNDTIVGFKEGNMPSFGGGNRQPVVVESVLVLDGQQIYRATQKVFQEELFRRAI